MVSPAVSTIGSPLPATVHEVEPAASRSTPKSDAAYRSPVGSSRTRSVIGRSARSWLRSVHVAVPATGL